MGELIRRVYEVDPLRCECRQQMRVLSFLADPPVIDKILRQLGHRTGFGVLYLGDVELASEDLASYGLEADAIDVAVVPFWHLLRPEGLALLQSRLRARAIVAVHVPPEEEAAVTGRLRDVDSGLVVLKGQGETVT